MILNLIRKESWRISKFCSVFKKSDQSEIKNYRPISIIIKFLNSFWMTELPHVMNQISHYQHGFVSKRSTVTNVASIAQFLCEHLDKQIREEVIYTDTSKVFDRVDHQILIHKMESFGFSTDFLALVKCYLSDVNTCSIVGIKLHCISKHQEFHKAQC